MTGIRFLRRWGVTPVLLVSALWAAGPAAAQAPPASITLADAVRTTLDKAPVVQLALENVGAQQATARVARGTFDGLFRVDPTFTHREDTLAHAGNLENELVKRGVMLGLARGFGNLTDELTKNINSGRADLPYCPADSGWSVFVATLPGSVLPVPLCKPVTSTLGVQADENASGGGFDVNDIYTRPSGLDPLADFELMRSVAGLLQVQLTAAAGNIRAQSLELLYKFRAITADVATRAALAYDRLGAVPTWQYTNSWTLVGDYTKYLRSGSTFQVQGTWDGRASQYREKPLDPIFGGRDAQNRFRTKIEAFWSQPLMRGRGAVTVKAPERAAARNVEASHFTFQQTAADQALVTADAYFSLVAAQETLALNRASLETQRRMLENTIKLVGAGEVASSDVVRARARTSEVQADVESARLSVIAAQADLAAAMGISSVEMAALAASDVFPAKPLDLDVEALSKEAVARRADVRAAAAFRDTSRILFDAAKADTRWRFDVQVSGGFGQAYYGPLFRSAPDELRVIGMLSDDSFVKYTSPTGLGRAYTMKWEPVAAITGSIELPFRNNQRLGRFAQATASVTESEIRLADLSRNVQNNVPQYADNLRRARAEWEQRQEAVIQYEATWDAAQRLRAAGEMTLIDTLLTEQQLTQARLQLVEAKRAHASAVARFKRETGTLLNFTDWALAQPNLAGIVAAK